MSARSEIFPAVTLFREVDPRDDHLRQSNRQTCRIAQRDYLGAALGTYNLRPEIEVSGRNLQGSCCYLGMGQALHDPD